MSAWGVRVLKKPAEDRTLIDSCLSLYWQYSTMMIHSGPGQLLPSNDDDDDVGGSDDDDDDDDNSETLAYCTGPPLWGHNT